MSWPPPRWWSSTSGSRPLAAQLAPAALVQVVTAKLNWEALPAHGVVRLVSGDGVAQPPGEPLAVDVVPALAVAAEAAALATVSDLAAVRPLAGLTVVVTRPADQADALATPLERLGARVVCCPPSPSRRPMTAGGLPSVQLSAQPQRYDWIVVTSVNGARRLLAHVADARSLAGVRLAAIGPATAAVLAEAHLPADLVPPRFVAESLLDTFPPPPPPGGRVLFGPRRGRPRRVTQRAGRGRLAGRRGPRLPHGARPAPTGGAARRSGRRHDLFHVAVHLRTVRRIWRQRAPGAGGGQHRPGHQRGDPHRWRGGDG